MLRDPQTARFRLWYGVHTADFSSGRSHLGHLESADGIRWIRPPTRPRPTGLATRHWPGATTASIGYAPRKVLRQRFAAGRAAETWPKPLTEAGGGRSNRGHLDQAGVSTVVYTEADARRKGQDLHAHLLFNRRVRLFDMANREQETQSAVQINNSLCILTSAAGVCCRLGGPAGSIRAKPSHRGCPAIGLRHLRRCDLGFRRVHASHCQQ